MAGTINGVSNTLVSTDSEIKTYLNTTFYETLAESTKETIVTHSFNLVSADYSSATGIGTRSVSELYNDGKTANTWEGKIGLLELRDWFMASGDKTGCTGSNGYYNKNLSNQTAANHAVNYKCSGENYMYINTEWWTITPLPNRHFVFIVREFGCTYDGSAYYSRAVRPVFYLSPNTQLTGAGTKGNPYKIKS